MTVSKVDLLAFLDRPIAYHSILARVGGGAKAGILLSQLLYWSGRGRHKDGWIYKDGNEWEEETCLTPDELRGARQYLKKLGLIEVSDVRTLGIDKFRTTLCYRIVFDVLLARIGEQIAQLNERRVRDGKIPTRTGKDQPPDSVLPGSDGGKACPDTTESPSQTSSKNNNSKGDTVDVVFLDGSTLSSVPRSLAEPLKFAVEKAEQVKKTRSAYAIGVLRKSTPEALVMAYEQELRRKEEESEAKAREEKEAAERAAADTLKEAESIARRMKAEALLKATIESGEGARRALVNQIKDAAPPFQGRRAEIDRFIADGDLPGQLVLHVMYKKLLEEP